MAKQGNASCPPGGFMRGVNGALEPARVRCRARRRLPISRARAPPGPLQNGDKKKTFRFVWLLVSAGIWNGRILRHFIQFPDACRRVPGFSQMIQIVQFCRSCFLSRIFFAQRSCLWANIHSFCHWVISYCSYVMWFFFAFSPSIFFANLREIAWPRAYREFEPRCELHIRSSQLVFWFISFNMPLYWNKKNYHCFDILKGVFCNGIKLWAISFPSFAIIGRAKMWREDDDNDGMYMYVSANFFTLTVKILGKYWVAAKYWSIEILKYA